MLQNIAEILSLLVGVAYRLYGISTKEMTFPTTIYLVLFSVIEGQCINQFASFMCCLCIAAHTDAGKVLLIYSVLPSFNLDKDNGPCWWSSFYENVHKSRLELRSPPSTNNEMVELLINLVWSLKGLDLIPIWELSC